MKYTEIKNLEKEIIVELENKKVKLPLELQEKIDENWNQLIENNNRFKRGIIYCVSSITEQRIKLILSDYAHYMYDMKNELPEKYKCRNCWAGTIIESSDNKYIIGKMNKYTSVPNKLQFSGGNIDNSEIHNGIVNMRECAVRELKEEMNIDINDFDIVKSFECKYLSKEIDKNSIGILYKLTLNKAYEEICKKYSEYMKYLERNNLEIEFSELVAVDKNKVKEFFENENIDYEDSTYPALLKDSLQ